MLTYSLALGENVWGETSRGNARFPPRKIIVIVQSKAKRRSFFTKAQADSLYAFIQKPDEANNSKVRIDGVNCLAQLHL